jgi:PAS domain S-box-containing protein
MRLEHLQAEGEAIGRSLLSSRQYYLIVLDLAGQYLAVNDYFGEAFGEGQESIPRSSVYGSLLPEDVERSIQRSQEALASPGRPVSHVLRKLDREGKLRWTAWEMSACTWEGRQALLCIGTDITPVHELEDRIGSLREDFARQIETFHMGLWVVNRQWEITRVNSLLEQVTGLKAGEVLGRSFWELFPDLLGSPYEPHYRRAMETRESVHFEKLYGGLWFQVHIFPNDGGLDIYFVNVTEDKARTAALAASESSLRSILNSSSDLIFFLDPCRRLLSFNRLAAERCHQQGHALSAGSDFSLYLPPQHQADFESCFERALAGENVETERQDALPSGEFLHFRISYHPVVEGEQRQGVVMTWTDITLLKRTEERLREQNQRLRQIARVQAHDIRGPLASVLGLVEILEDMPLDAEQREIAALLHQAAQDLDQVVRGIVGRTEEADA